MEKYNNLHIISENHEEQRAYYILFHNEMDYCIIDDVIDFNFTVE